MLVGSVGGAKDVCSSDLSKIDDYNVYRWKEGLYCFRNKPFADIIKDLEKYYDLSIQMDKK